MVSNHKWFPYRNDIRKILVPYLQKLNEKSWVQTHPSHPNSIAWIISHITLSEDEWIHKTGLQIDPVITTVPSSHGDILNAYLQIREQTDQVLTSLTADQLNTVVQVPVFADGWSPPSEPTWKWLFHHVYMHEAYHAGQIGVIARLNGFPGPGF